MTGPTELEVERRAAYADGYARGALEGARRWRRVAWGLFAVIWLVALSVAAVSVRLTG